MVPRLAFAGVTHAFESVERRVVAVEDLSIEVPPGGFVSLIGRSGCGKSTLFNIAAGLLAPTAGRVLLDGDDITGRAGLVSYMLQKDLLVPWRTILDNVILGLEVARVPKSIARTRALPLLHRYGLGEFTDRYPAELSGGMRQRAALLRTLLCERNVLLLDEPLGALDAQTRFEMQAWLLQLWHDFDRTIVLVTHDVDEAVFLSDRIFVLSPRPGRLRAVIDVPLPRPRARAVVTSPEFTSIKQACLDLLFESEEQAAA